MIQIDDAGSGSLIGGTCIGIYRVETEEFSYSIIPLKYYNEANFKRKYYINYTKIIIKRLLNTLNVPKEESIQICRGYIFDETKKWLTSKGYNWINNIITGPLQIKIEEAFINHALSLGLPKGFLSYTKYPFHFHRLLKWIYADYEKRFPLCKRGWDSWQKYNNLNVIKSYDFVKHNKFYCLKCGRKIYSNTPLVKYKFYSNRVNEIYLHKDCVDLNENSLLLPSMS